MIALRAAGAADVPAICAIENVAFTDPWSPRAFAELLRNDSARVEVADASVNAARADGASTESPRVVGYSVLLLAGAQADLANLAVAPEARGAGVGRALVRGVIATARREGVREIYLEVRESNAAALALYRAAGFKAVGRRRAYYSDPVEDARVLRAVLGAV